MLSTRDPPQNKGHIWVKVKGWKKIFHINGDPKKAAVAILISDKIDFKMKSVKRAKEGHYIMIKGSIQEDITIINICAPNIAAPQYVRQMLTSMKEEINNNTIVRYTHLCLFFLSCLQGRHCHLPKFHICVY